MNNNRKEFVKRMAIQKKNEKILLSVNPKLNNGSGIYFLTRSDENGINYFYIGQSLNCRQRMLSHMVGYQHIDLSIKKRGWYSAENPYGWKVGMINYPAAELDKWEQYWILEYTKKGYQCRYNKTGGGQGEGKEKIGEFRPQKGYRDGLKQGYKNASRDVAALFDKHLDYKPKNDPPNHHQLKAMEKFKEFLEHYKGNEGE